MKGAINSSSTLAISPRCGRPGASPTPSTPSRNTSIAAIERIRERRIPSQSVYIPETNNISDVAEVKTAVE